MPESNIQYTKINTALRILGIFIIIGASIAAFSRYQQAVYEQQAIASFRNISETMNQIVAAINESPYVNNVVIHKVLIQHPKITINLDYVQAAYSIIWNVLEVIFGILLATGWFQDIGAWIDAVEMR